MAGAYHLMRVWGGEGWCNVPPPHPAALLWPVP